MLNYEHEIEFYKYDEIPGYTYAGSENHPDGAFESESAVLRYDIKDGDARAKCYDFAQTFKNDTADIKNFNALVVGQNRFTACQTDA
jgi:hypothetical protein